MNVSNKQQSPHNFMNQPSSHNFMNQQSPHNQRTNSY